MRVYKRIEWRVFLLALLALGGFSLYGIVVGDDDARLSGGDAQAITQTIGFPSGVAVDGIGGFYVSSQAQHSVYRVAADGSITLIAGTGAGGFSGDGGPATAAKLNDPNGIALDAAGNLYIADASNNRIRKVTTAGIINTVAGYGASMGPSGDGGPAAAAQLFIPNSVAFDSEGNLYIADTGHSRIRKVTPAGIISTVVGNGISGYNGDGGPATAAQLAMPASVAFDSAGNLYIADRFNDRIRKVMPSGIISTVVGKETRGYSGDGGSATAAQLRGPNSIAIDFAGNLYISDQGNHRIRKVTTTGIISTVAGNENKGYNGDGGLAIAAQLNDPRGVAIDSAGNLYITEYQNNRIRKVTTAGLISTVAGNGEGGFIRAADPRSRTIEQPYIPTGAAVDSTVNTYIDRDGYYHIRNVIKPILASAQVVENPRTPRAQNAGRVIIPKEVMTISGNGQGAYSFVVPSAPSVMPDGSLLIREYTKDQIKLLLFDKNGRFLLDLMKEGGGRVFFAGYFKTAKNIVVLSSNPDNSLLWFNSAGKFEHEISLPFKVKGLPPLAFLNDTFYFGPSSGMGIRDLRGEPRIIDMPMDIFSFTEGSGALKPLTSFTSKHLFKGCKSSGGGSISCGGSFIGTFIAVPYQAKYLVVSHTGEYLLKIYDPASNTIIREFRRDYDRVKSAPGKHDDLFVIGKLPTSSDLDYENDILNIFTSGDDIWVLTSTRDETKGALIDLFDGSGVYKDSFYLKLPEPALQSLRDTSRSTIYGNALYMRNTENDTSVINKYLIEK
jgi:sugar lactone lactonase YvrE